MHRVQLLEIQDQPWCPRSIRDAITDTIQFGLNIFGFFRPIYPHLKDAVQSSGAKTILDLGSGAGGPWLRMWKIFDGDGIQICLSDKYPNRAAYERIERVSGGKISFHRESVNSLRLPCKFDGFRTLFNAFHHFKSDDASAILKNAVDCGQGLGVFESIGRHLLSFLLVCGMPIFAFLSAPFIRPFRWSRLFWTNIIPAAPIVAFIDGIISCLRAYSVREMQELIMSLPPNHYNWIVGKEREGILSAPILYMIGVPSANDNMEGV